MSQTIVPQYYSSFSKKKSGLKNQYEAELQKKVEEYRELAYVVANFFISFREISKTERRKEQEVLEFQKKMKAGAMDLQDDPVLRPEAKRDNIAIIRHEVSCVNCLIPHFLFSNFK